MSPVSIFKPSIKWLTVILVQKYFSDFKGTDAVFAGMTLFAHFKKETP